MGKVKRVLDQLEGMLYNTHQREAKEELSSIKLILELLVNDRDLSGQSRTEDFEKNTAQFNESEPPKSMSEREKYDDRKALQEQKMRLESLCNMYQKKLDELNLMQQPNPHGEVWQNMQMMNN